MAGTERFVEDILKEKSYQIAAEVLAEKAAAQGVVLTSRERRKFIDHLKAGAPGDNFRIRRQSGGDVSIEITTEDLNILDERLSKLGDEIPELVQSRIDELSREGLVAVKRGWGRERRRENRRRRGFERRLYKQWGVGIDRLKLSLSVSREFGANTYSRLQGEADLACPNLLEVLARLHARGCQVTEEIVRLISAGLADGAMARWRTLHEIAVVSMFLRGRGEEMALRYIDHQAVESRRAAHEYLGCFERLGYEEMSAEEVEAYDRAFEDVMKKHGPGFERHYGWAGGEGGIKNPTFPNIEKEASLDHLRGHYRMASHNVHANPKGVFFKIGLAKDSACRGLAGPSNVGLADPGHAAAISLLQTSTALGLIRPTVDSIATLKILTVLVDEVGEALIEAHRRLEGSEG